ncbi:MAG: hypothetical protein ACI9AR_000518, partial [Flavobacteriaceae bacterium]
FLQFFHLFRIAEKQDFAKQNPARFIGAYFLLFYR